MELIRRIGLKGIAYWRAVWNVAPWGADQDERRHGEILAAMAAANGATRVTPEMFMKFRVGPNHG